MFMWLNMLFNSFELNQIVYLIDHHSHLTIFRTSQHPDLPTYAQVLNNIIFFVQDQDNVKCAKTQSPSVSETRFRMSCL